MHQDAAKALPEWLPVLDLGCETVVRIRFRQDAPERPGQAGLAVSTEFTQVTQREAGEVHQPVVRDLTTPYASPDLIHWEAAAIT
jgi:hypothetical protein